MSDSRYRYTVYGIVVVSDTRLALAESGDAGLARIDLRSAPASVFGAAREHARAGAPPDSWYRFAPLDDGSTYVGWDGIGEFLVAPGGRTIAWRRIDGSSIESFEVYMLGQALSFALVKQRFEPLHATAVVVGDRAVAFLGENGSGKSSLAACFVAAGHRLLTDDLLLLRERAGQMIAFAGPARIKLFPQIAGRFFGPLAGRLPMNPDTQKVIVPLDGDGVAAAPAPLGAVYALAPPRDVARSDRIRVDPLAPRDALMEVVKGTFNRRLVDADRLARQFELAARVAALVPVRRLAYPRALDRVSDVRDAILADAVQLAAAVDGAPC